MLSFDAMKQWGAELKDMNREKEGHQYVYLHLPLELMSNPPHLAGLGHKIGKIRLNAHHAKCVAN